LPRVYRSSLSLSLFHCLPSRLSPVSLTIFPLSLLSLRFVSRPLPLPVASFSRRYHPSFLLSGLLPLTAPFEVKKRFRRQVDSHTNYTRYRGVPRRGTRIPRAIFSMKGREREGGKSASAGRPRISSSPFLRPIGQRVSGETIARREPILCTRASHLPSDFPVQAATNDRVTDPSSILSPTRDVHPRCALRSTSLSPPSPGPSSSLRKRVNGVRGVFARDRSLARAFKRNPALCTRGACAGSRGRSGKGRTGLKTVLAVG